MKIFKGVKINFKAISASIKIVLELINQGNFFGAGETLAKMETLVIDTPTVKSGA